LTIEALLIDLDGTLVLFDHEKFISEYFRFASTYFPEIEGKTFAHLLAFAEESVRNNDDPSETNIDTFLNIFCPEVSMDREEVLSRFVEFYNTGYDRLQEIVHFQQSKGAISLLKKAKMKSRHSAIKFTVSLKISIRPILSLKKAVNISCGQKRRSCRFDCICCSKRGSTCMDPGTGRRDRT